MNQRLHDLFEYADGKLFWRVNRGCIHAGDEAGTLQKTGAAKNRIYITVDGKKHLLHRVIWFLHHNEVPEFLDHIDGDPLNNKIENLRPATKAQNAMNRKIRSDNSTGFKGIYPTTSKKFAATIYIDGMSKYLGTYDTPEMAQAAYAQAANANFKEYARV
jgi:hypothetical protein